MTIYNFNEELPSLGSGPAISDVTFVYNTASGRVKQMTVSQSRYKTVTKSTIVGSGSSVGISANNSSNSTSTSAFMCPNEGFINLQVTTTGGLVVLPPTAPGQELFIAYPSPKTTGVFQIQVSSSYGSSSPSFDGTNTILSVASSTAWGVGLISLTTVLWGMVGGTNPPSTVSVPMSLSTGG